MSEQKPILIISTTENKYDPVEQNRMTPEELQKYVQKKFGIMPFTPEEEAAYDVDMALWDIQYDNYDPTE